MARHITPGNSRSEKQRRERKYRLRAKTTRFIPDGDSDFARMARQFAGHVEAHAERFGLSAEQVANISGAVDEFRDALHKTMMSDTCGLKATRTKNDARAKAEQAIRGAAGIIRGQAVAHGSITSADRLMLNMHERPKRMKRRACPQIAPMLKFRGSPQDGTGSNAARHILEYGNHFDWGSNAKPHGAARLELFVGLVPPEWANQRKVPAHPDQLSGGPLWYLRSFSTSRFEVEFPVMADGTAMLVVYWGRWADATGAVGPFSKTCVARVEGGPLPALPMYIGTRPALAAGVSRRIEVKHVVIREQPPLALPDHLEGDEHIEAVRMLPGG